MSSIRPKKKLLSCGCYTYNFSRDRCKMHATIEDTNKRHLKQIEKEKIEEMKHKANPKPLKTTKVRKGTFVLPVENSIVSAMDYLKGGNIGIQHKTEEASIETEIKLFWWRAASVIDRNPKCWECGDYIFKPDYRAATAHIFPKSLFPSVAANEWNYVVCGARCGCHNKTHRMDTFSQMKIFPVAVQRYLKFGHLITEKHKYLDLFLEYANKIT